MKFLRELVDLIFPKLCCTCDQLLTKNEVLVCFHCRSQLPKICIQNPSRNELVNRFYGKLDTNFAVSYLYFYKSGITQTLLHQFKYNNFPEIGQLIGKWIGYELVEKGLIENIDTIIPVPLHSKKKRKRGYNQSEFFAQGISEVTSIPTDFKSLCRINYEKSQTLKTREQRWESVKNAIVVNDSKKIADKNILLVDDIITTGATLEACGIQLLSNGAASTSIATIALAK